MADPTVADVFNQLVLVNGKLDAIDTNTFGQANAINNLDADVNTGFNKSVQWLQILAKIDVELVKLVFHVTQQNDAMICALEKISRNTCALHTESVKQTRLQTRMAEDLDVLRGVAESAYPAAALERSRLKELEAKIERCCPPEEPKPACQYEPCPQPRPAREPDLPKIDVPQEPRPVG